MWNRSVLFVRLGAASTSIAVAIIVHIECYSVACYDGAIVILRRGVLIRGHCVWIFFLLDIGEEQAMLEISFN